MLCYICALQELFITAPEHHSNPGAPLSPIQSREPNAMMPAMTSNLPRPRLTLGGYSYGSMIASHLPPCDTVQQVFAAPAADSPESEIRLKAATLAKERWKWFNENMITQKPRGRSLNQTADSGVSPTHAVALGGFESESASRRASHDSRRSSEFRNIRRSLDRVSQRLNVRRTRTDAESVEDCVTMPAFNLVMPELSYLLISPVLPPISAFATMFSKLSFSSKLNSFPVHDKDIATGSAGQELGTHPTLAVFGDHDIFASHKKLCKWARQLSSRSQNFKYVSISGAGHFWHEDGVEEQLREAIANWRDG